MTAIKSERRDVHNGPRHKASSERVRRRDRSNIENGASTTELEAVCRGERKGEIKRKEKIKRPTEKPFNVYPEQWPLS